ncbi:MAG: transposase domain-containing protein [Clostridia bacterium]
MFSLIETAKENELDPYRYLVYILKTAPSLDQTTENWVAPLLPQNAPDGCKVPK